MATSVAKDWGGQFDDLWRRLGPETRTALVELLPDDWSFAGKRVLDFGSGWGRTLGHFAEEAQDAEFWGVDVDAACIERLQRELCPPMHAALIAPDPPLAFEDASFDLAWSISVFTHLTDNSLAWLLELHRVLKPGGLLIATFMGRSHAELFTGEPWDEDRVGMLVMRHAQSFEDGGPMVLMSDWWMREHWGRAFEVVDIAQMHNQSWVLLRRRDRVLTLEELERPADDPRELAALRFNVKQTQRELDFGRRIIRALEQRHADELDAVRREYERSLSWRLTRPLREGLNAARRRRAGRPSWPLSTSRLP
jgi:SAM-dependent methyltransferase